MNGWTGQILRIDLSSGSIVKEPLDVSTAKKYIGGRGLGPCLMFAETDPSSTRWARRTS